MVEEGERRGAFEFGIAHWHAWAPGVASQPQWLQWLDNQHAVAEAERADVGFLPPMTRRRLNDLGRMALHTVWPCIDGLDEFEYVFASRYGALNRAVKNQRAIAEGTPLSPAIFSMSVHNGIAGLLSIIRQNHCRATAMAAGDDTLNTSLIEAAMMLAEGGERVVVTFADNQVPAIYEPVIEPVTPFAVSLLLTAQGGQRMRWTPAATDAGGGADVARALMRVLLNQAPAAVIGRRQPWRLERASG